MSRRAPSKQLEWKTEHIPADDPFARFAASAQVVLVRRMVAANRNHRRKYSDELNRTREAQTRARRNLKRVGTERLSEKSAQAPNVVAPSNFAPRRAIR
jgi:hypothetical protein